MSDTTEYTHVPGSGPQLVYRHSDGQSFSVVDRQPPGSGLNPDDDLREQRICLALLRHAIDMIKGEDTL